MQLDLAAETVYTVLSRHAADGKCRMSIRDIQRECYMMREAIGISINELIQAGKITRQSGDKSIHQQSEYTLL